MINALSHSFVPARGAALANSWWRPGIAILSLGVLALGLQGFVAPDGWAVVTAFLLASGAILVAAIRRPLRGAAHTILADHLLLLTLSYIAYNVIGALLIPLGPKEEAEFALSYYSVDAPLAMQVLAMNSIGLGIALVCGSLVRRFIVSRWDPKAINVGRSIPTGVAIAVFVIVGGISTFYVVVTDTNADAGLLPGVVRTMSQFLLVAIMVCAAQQGRSAQAYLATAIILTLAHAAGGFIMLHKSNVLLPLVALSAGLVWRFGIRRVFVPSLVIILSVYMLIGDAVSSTRNLYGPHDEFEWTERIHVLSDALFHPEDRVRPDEKYYGWARFSYTPAQAAAIVLYDSGRGDRDFELLGWSFLPRFLFPEKPSMTASGREFHIKVTGAENSQTAHGVFINGYYNLGWWGIIIVGVFAGCALACTSAFAAAVFRARVVIWLPLALLGSLMAFQIDGHFLSHYWGPSVLFAVAVAAGSLLYTTDTKSARKR
jgi:hypothetical protein